MVANSLSPAPAADLRSSAYQADTAFLGMVIFMASWAMLFAGLFFAYGIMRAGTHPWPPSDLPGLPLGLPGVASVALALSSVAMQTALVRVRKNLSGAGIYVFAAFGLGATFLLLQTIVWKQLWLVGLQPNTGTFASVFYALTVFHALHVVVGLIALVFLGTQALRGRYSALVHIPLRLWTLYWHMVGVVWLMMYVLIYLV
jgi:cytochrome c oxidase subunit III